MGGGVGCLTTKDSSPKHSNIKILANEEATKAHSCHNRVKMPTVGGEAFLKTTRTHTDTQKRLHFG